MSFTAVAMGCLTRSNVDLNDPGSIVGDRLHSRIKFPQRRDTDVREVSLVGRRQADWLRAMYVGGRGNAVARRYARFWSVAFRLGLLPRRWVTLEVPGRRTGGVTRFPLGMADVGGQWYLVSMLGECNWVRNVRAAGGLATLRRRRARQVRLVEIPVEERARVIRRYLERVPGGRPHIPLDRHEPVEAFESIASNYPVFRIVPL